MSYMSQIASFSSELVPKLMCATLSRIGGTVQYFHELLWLLSQRPQGTLANTQRVFLKDVCVFFLSIQGNFHQALYCFYNQANFLSLCWKVFYVKIVGDWFVSSSFFLLSRGARQKGERRKSKSKVSQRRANISSCISHRYREKRRPQRTKKNFPAQVDNLNAKCKPFNAVARAASICRLGVYNIIQKKFKRIKEGGENSRKSQHVYFLD